MNPSDARTQESKNEASVQGGIARKEKDNRCLDLDRERHRGRRASPPARCRLLNRHGSWLWSERRRIHKARGVPPDQLTWIWKLSWGAVRVGPPSPGTPTARAGGAVRAGRAVDATGRVGAAVVAVLWGESAGMAHRLWHGTARAGTELGHLWARAARRARWTMAALTSPAGPWKRGGREEDSGDCEMRRVGRRPEMLVDLSIYIRLMGLFFKSVNVPRVYMCVSVCN